MQALVDIFKSYRRTSNQTNQGMGKLTQISNKLNKMYTIYILVSPRLRIITKMVTCFHDNEIAIPDVVM